MRMTSLIALAIGIGATCGVAAQEPRGAAPGPSDVTGHGMPGPGRVGGGEDPLSGAWGGPSTMVRHRAAMLNGLPALYRGINNPLPGLPAVIEAGGRIYQETCASCHGVVGTGAGPDAGKLNPRPQNLDFVMSRPIATDGYLLWAIAEGGKDLGTDMPAYQDSLQQREIWAVIAYMRAGFPEIAKGEK